MSTEQAVSPTTHQCAVLERGSRGYQRHLGLEAGTAMEVDAGSGGWRPGVETFQQNYCQCHAATVANSMDAPMKGTTPLVMVTRNTGLSELTAGPPPVVNTNALTT
jgi:hypothetical protein